MVFDFDKIPIYCPKNIDAMKANFAAIMYTLAGNKTEGARLTLSNEFRKFVSGG